mmetsp:Transcript_14639/g.35362  ORF Transcript_14639/g.35362 Transcript_14639/m.35362 type:complete len:472 (+) Transcript_14639:269-1684(+)
MGIGSLFIVNNKTEALCALKHWGPTVAATSVCDKVFESHRQSVKKNLYSDVITTDGKQYIFHITRGEITYIATTETETEPLMVVEFLTQLHTVLKAYFSEVTESVLQEHHVTLYQLLDEMLDSGIPVNTHPGGLKVLVPPPNLLNRVSSTVFGHQGVLVSDHDPLKLLPLPWRSNNIKYASNEIYLDVIESIDATLDTEGRVLSSAIHGTIEVNSRLSGMPDISMSLSNSHLIEEYSFHPSVRLSRFAADRVVSFVPADGNFTLMSYKVRQPQTNAMQENSWQPKYVKPNPWLNTAPGSGNNPTNVPLPLYIRPQATFGASQGRVSIVCGTKPAFEKPVESVNLEVRLPDRVTSADPSCTHGTATYDDIGHHVKWVIDKFPNDKTPCLTVQLQLSSNTPKKGSAEAEAVAANGGKTMVALQELVDIHANFSVAGVGVSGIKVETLQVRNEKYKPSQGVRYHTRGGRVVVRT